LEELEEDSKDTKKVNLASSVVPKASSDTDVDYAVQQIDTPPILESETLSKEEGLDGPEATDAPKSDRAGASRSRFNFFQNRVEEKTDNPDDAGAFFFPRVVSFFENRASRIESFEVEAEGERSYFKEFIRKIKNYLNNKQEIEEQKEATEEIINNPPVVEPEPPVVEPEGNPP